MTDCVQYSYVRRVVRSRFLFELKQFRYRNSAFWSVKTCSARRRHNAFIYLHSDNLRALLSELGGMGAVW